MMSDHISDDEHIEYGYLHSNALQQFCLNWSVASGIKLHVIQQNVT